MNKSALRFGCCGCMIDPEKDPIGIEVVEDCAALGYDYIELSLRDAAALQEEEFTRLLRRLEKSGLPAEACNNFYPPERRITGPKADFAALQTYTEAALKRAQAMNAKIVVFGSSGARNIPEGFPRERAWAQIVQTTKMIDDLAARFGLTAAIEYHNRKEANVLTSMEEALRLRREISGPSVEVLADYYHFALENESLEAVRKAGRHIVHVHFADPVARGFPVEPKAEFDAFFKVLGETGYSGRISLEAFTQNFKADSEKALQVLKEATAPSAA